MWRQVSKYKNPFEGPFKVVKDKKIKIVKRKSAYSSKPLPNDLLNEKRKKKIYIHVNQHVIRANKKNNDNDPVITIKQGNKNTYCHEVEIKGPSRVRYGGNDKPILSCGARVVIETESEIEVIK